MRINHNIQALNAYRNLSQTMGSTSKSLEKLSSGLRINRAADDAAGLAISEKMRSQIRGLGMAERNSLDAVSLIQTAEGALNEAHSILQRMRELSVQASNGTVTDDDRKAIQSEIDQLTYEIDRISDTTQFNQKKLFSGNEKGKAYAEVNSNQVQYDPVNKNWAGTVTAQPTDPAKVDIEFTDALGALKSSDIEGKTFTINGIVYEIDVTDGDKKGINHGNIAVNISGWKDDATKVAEKVANMNKLLDALAPAIKANDPSFDVLSNSAVNNGDGTLTNGSLQLSTKIPMSPKDVKDMPGTNEKIETDLTKGVNFLDPYNGNAPVTELSANLSSNIANSFTIDFSEVPKDGDSLKIDNLTINFGSTAAPYSNGAATIDVTGKDISTVLGEIKDILTQAKADTVTKPVEALTPVFSVQGTTLTLGTDKTDDGSLNGLEIELVDKDSESYQNKDLELKFQIGANTSESLDISLSIMDASSLGIGFHLDGTTPTLVGVNAEKGVNVSTEDAAQAAISLFDIAIEKVSAERSKLGAYQNRLEHTVTNLQTANENLTAAEARIRDLDMALEMSNFTKNNILNQAGQAMLAQANQLPQGILQLLQ